MHTRHCVCGCVIVGRKPLCVSCFTKYGGDSEKWPAWVRFIVRDEQKEMDRERNHDYDLEYFDETTIPISDEAEHNLAKVKREPEIDFEDFIWSNQ